MICKDVEFKWNDEQNISFSKIKTAISQAPVLRSPNFDRDLFLYTFASDESLFAVLTRMDDDKNEALVLFMRTIFRGPK
jgi:hypothetical protein